ncbi:MAG: methyltransferase domain-containing protein [Candidatus Glassbacteria bacterium]
MQFQLLDKIDVASVRPLPEVLESLPDGIERILSIRSAPEALLRGCLAEIRRRWPACCHWLLCHRGRNIEGCRPIYYPDDGFFRPEKVDTAGLARLNFDLTLVPYATDRRLSPGYHHVDQIAESAGARFTLICYRDGTALPVDADFFALKRNKVVRPYLERKQAAIGEIYEFTGEEPEVVERRCELAGIEAVRLWQEKDPHSDGQVRRYYSENDFYVYELMKTEYNGDRDELMEAVLAECEPGALVADYGAGVGIFSLPLARAGAQVTHVDLPGPLLEFARHRFARRGLPARFLAVKGARPLLERYDMVVSIYVVEHLVDPLGALRHMAGHVRPGGKLAIAVDFEQGRTAGELLPLHLAHLDPAGYYAFMESLGLSRVRSHGGLDVFVVPN